MNEPVAGGGAERRLQLLHVSCLDLILAPISESEAWSSQQLLAAGKEGKTRQHILIFVDFRGLLLALPEPGLLAVFVSQTGRQLIFFRGAASLSSLRLVFKGSKALHRYNTQNWCISQYWHTQGNIFETPESCGTKWRSKMNYIKQSTSTAGQTPVELQKTQQQLQGWFLWGPCTPSNPMVPLPW